MKKKQQAINESIDEQIKSAENLSTSLKEQEKISKSISSSFGVKSFAGLAGIVKSLPGLGALSTPFEEAAEASRVTRANQVVIFEGLKKQREEDLNRIDNEEEITDEVKKRLGLQDGDVIKLSIESADEYQKRIKSFVKPLDKLPGTIDSIKSGFGALSGVLKTSFATGLIAAFTDELLLVNTQTVELQKSLALSAGEAADLRNDFAGAAASSENINISTTALLETVTALSKQFGLPYFI